MFNVAFKDILFFYRSQTKLKMKMDFRQVTSEVALKLSFDKFFKYLEMSSGIVQV